MADRLRDALAARFLDAPNVPDTLAGNSVLESIAARGSCRSFSVDPVPLGVIQTLSAVALSSPSKSDLQQRDIVVVQDGDLKTQLLDLVSAQTWISAVPNLLVFCANNRRQRQLHEVQKLEFANDHLDAFFNASVDTGIALASFVIAAEAAGLGCCPISTIRNHAKAVSELLELPDHVLPVAGLALGYPAGMSRISQRLPVRTTVHVDRFRDENFEDDLAEYDAHRAEMQPYERQRSVARYGSSDAYTWSVDKARQYSLSERADFADFVKAKGFRLE